MKLSEFIKVLEKLRKEHGDHQVAFWNRQYDETSGFSQVLSIIDGQKVWIFMHEKDVGPYCRKCGLDPQIVEAKDL